MTIKPAFRDPLPDPAGTPRNGGGAGRQGQGEEPGLNANAARIRKRSVVIAGHQTSVSLENAFWEELRELAGRRRFSLNALITEIDGQRTGNLSSAIRVFVLEQRRRSGGGKN